LLLRTTHDDILNFSAVDTGTLYSMFYGMSA
jgi:hypothetical protein